MCGIAGIFSVKHHLDSKQIATMSRVLKHRGPDDEGFLAVDTRVGDVQHLVSADSKVDGQRIEAFTSSVNLYLGHRRLSIIDPSPAGHQPMADNDQTLWIVFNGEIYNYIELREELKQKGHRFRTGTDTEVILTAYRVWGNACVEKFNGMWAFVIYDKKKNILFGSRDRFGVKPLYYFNKNGYFAFASEIKAFFCLPFIDKKINPAAVFDYLVFGAEERHEEGFVRGIIELTPAHCFTVDLYSCKFHKWRYFTLNFANIWEKYDAIRSNQYANDVEQLIYDAIRVRLRSDVPIGSCLSGGIDSSSIVCVINDLLSKEVISQVGNQQRVFTASYDEPSIDESRWAKIVVENTDTKWHQTFPQPVDLLHDIEDLVYTQDVPFGSTSIYAQYRVMKLAHENGIKVLLDGQGGDELFTGYAPYYTTFFAEMLKNMDFLTLRREWKRFGNSSVTRNNLIHSLALHYALCMIPQLKIPVLNFLKRESNSFISLELWSNYRSRAKLYEQIPSKGLNDMLYRLMTGGNLKTLLKYEDRNSMRFSIESRTPFADDVNLIEYVFNIPSIYKIHDGWSKSLLRTSMRRVLPERIQRRKDKIGFATPEYLWLNRLKEPLKAYFTTDLKEYVNVDFICREWDRILANQSKIGITEIWRYINLAVWLKVFKHRTNT